MIKVEEEGTEYKYSAPRHNQNAEVESSSEDISSANEYIPTMRRRSRRRKDFNGRGEYYHKFNMSLWLLEENLAYMQFLINNELLFCTTRSERKSFKVNVLMSMAIRTRSPDQCRSHHQKMMKFHKSIRNIIEHIQSLKTDHPRQEDELNLPVKIQEGRTEDPKIFQVKIEEQKTKQIKGEQVKVECDKDYIRY